MQPILNSQNREDVTMHATNSQTNSQTYRYIQGSMYPSMYGYVSHKVETGWVSLSLSHG